MEFFPQDTPEERDRKIAEYLASVASGSSPAPVAAPAPQPAAPQPTAVPEYDSRSTPTGAAMHSLYVRPSGAAAPTDKLLRTAKGETVPDDTHANPVDAAKWAMTNRPSGAAPPSAVLTAQSQGRLPTEDDFKRAAAAQAAAPTQAAPQAAPEARKPLRGDVHVLDERGQPLAARQPSMGGGGLSGIDGSTIAAFLDLFLNQGRNIGAILGGGKSGMTEAERQRLGLEGRRVAADERMTEARIAEMGRERTRPTDPLAERRVALGERRFEASQADADAERAEQEALESLGSEVTRSYQDAAISFGTPEAEARKLTGAQIKFSPPQLGQLAQQLRSDDAWRERFATTEAAAQGREQRGAERDVAKEERGATREAGVRARKFQQEFQDKERTNLNIVGLMQDIDESPEAGPAPSFWSRFKNTITARGMNPDELESWQAKHMVMEQWAREQTGAAISATEDGRFVQQTGLNPTASREQVEAAYAVLRRVVQRDMAAAAVADPEAARGVLRIYVGDENTDAWLGSPASPRRAAKPLAGKPAAAPKRVSNADLEGF